MRISRIRIESESDPEPQTESESQPNPNQPNPNLDRIRIPIYRIRIETLPNRIPNRIPGSWNSIPDQIPSELSLKPNPNRTESVRPSVRRLSVRPAGRFSEIWQSNKKTTKNRYYPLKFLEFRVESPKGNEIQEILNFKETTFFDMSSAQPADFRKSDKVSKKYKSCSSLRFFEIQDFLNFIGLRGLNTKF